MPPPQTTLHKKYLFLVCFIAAMGGFLFGFDTAVISGALSFVVADFHFDAPMEGWFVSSALLGCIIGVAVSGKLSDVYGRKKIMLLSAGLFFLSAIGCMLAGNAASLICFRLIGGLGIGVASMICPLYISEFSPPSFRGRMVALYQLAITIGIVTAYFSNAWLLKLSAHKDLEGWLHYLIVQDTWRSMIGVGIIPSLLFLICLFLVPESPRWLLLKGKEELAFLYLSKLNTPATAREEIGQIKNSMKGEQGTLKQLFSPVYRIPLIIGLALPFLSQASGINAVIYYGPAILDKAGFSLGDALGGQVIIGFVNVLFTFVAIFTVDRWGRKPLLFIGIAGAVLSLLVIGILFRSENVQGPLVLFFILLFIACFAFSFGPVCWIVVSEIFPGAVRGQAMSLATLSLWIANFFVGQLTPMMLKNPHWGPSATFWTFAALCAPGFWLTWRLIPETKGRSLEQIEQFWKKSYFFVAAILLSSLVANAQNNLPAPNAPNLLAPNSSAPEDLLKYVNPEIGTAHSRWFFYTPAAVPEGMAKLAPSTNGHYGNPSGWEAVGYDTRQNSIEGFVHFHEWQVGGISFMPTNGPLLVKPGDLDKPHSGYRSRFDRKNQVAEPGYYKVLLDDYQITAELTATKRVGFHRYTFPANEHSHIILDIGNTQGESGEVTDAAIHMIDDTHFDGFVTTYPKYVHQYDPEGKVCLYFYGELSKKPESVGSFTVDKTNGQSNSAKGKGAGLFLNYRTAQNDTIEIKVGLSYTSTANAKNNLLAEAAHLSFDEAKARAQATWQQELGRISVTGSNDADKIKFYTGLFHALLGRGVASDVNGAYPKHGGLIGQLPNINHSASGSHAPAFHHFINTDAIWGAYWNLTQLWSLSYPEYYEDYVHTQLQIYKDKGWFGDGIANSEYVSGVGTNFVGLAIAAAWRAGIRDYDVNLAYQAVRGNELGWKNRPVGSGKMDTRAFLEHGYSPFLDEDKTDSTGSHFSVSHTLEYSFSAFAAAQMARSLGKKDDYEKLIRYSDGWRNLYNPANKLLQPKRADGSFIDKFDPYAPWRGYQEGNAMQYTFYVPQNPAALIATLGKDYFNDNLNDIFDKSAKDDFGGGKTINAFAGITSIYNHGNEPSLHISWLFNFSGKPWLTQKWTRAICDSFYGIEPIHGYGYGQDEDQGQLGSWYVMTALGLFDVKGFTDARPTIQLGSPLFARASIQLGNGRMLTIETKDQDTSNVKRELPAGNIYVQSVKFNGRRLDNCWLYRDELMRGGKLVFVMGAQPNMDWGVKNLPPSAQ